MWAIILIQAREVISMDDYGIDDNYVVKIVAGVIIGLVVLFLVIPLAANMIATNNVANAADSTLQDLNTVDSSLPSTADNVMPDTSQDKAIPKNNSNTDNSVPKDNKVSPEGMTILSGTIITGSSLSSKSVCKIYVGKEYAGADIKISTLYSRDGKDLNAGRLVSKTVDSTGYVTLTAADSYDLYPDECLISIYDTNNNELDYMRVYLKTESGTQSF